MASHEDQGSGYDPGACGYERQGRAVDVEVFSASQRAWLRRPELDGPNYDAWELPDGKLWAAPKGVTPKIAVLNDPLRLD